MAETTGIRFSIDRGGTFTDIYAELPDGKGYRVLKLLSEDPANYPDAPREGIRRILEEYHNIPITDGDIDPVAIEWIRMGTTVATNALLERHGARCALLITRGFRDLLQIGNQNRPTLFDLEIRQPELLYESVVEIDERIRLVRPEEAAAGNNFCQGLSGDRIEILQPLDEERISRDLEHLKEQDIDSIAVVCMHGYTFAAHEQRIGEIARELDFTQISLSSEVIPMIKMVGRGDTTVVDAYLAPHIRKYIGDFKAGFLIDLAGANLLFMRSDGGLTAADSFTGSRAILSGPAGGVVGYAMTTSRELANKPVIGFDMGGTSTDVSRYAGDYEIVHETETAGVRIQAPQLDIKTVAAGGGSRLFFRHGMFEVGPESAGAHPGPVCYRKNGYLTITDANLVLGRLLPEFFPEIFGPRGDMPLDIEASRKAFADLTTKINEYRRSLDLEAISMEQAACGFVQVANETMVRPIREISVARDTTVRTTCLPASGEPAASMPAPLPPL